MSGTDYKKYKENCGIGLINNQGLFISQCEYLLGKYGENWSGFTKALEDVYFAK